MRKLIYLYILECADETLYTGVTNDLESRLHQHQTGTNKNSYTFSRRPVKLLFHIKFIDTEQAFLWETRIKKWSKAKKLALINQDWDSLSSLSRKKFKSK